MKAAKAAKEAIQPEVDALLALKAEYKVLTGKDFGAPASAPKEEPAKAAPGPKKMAPNPENAAKKAAKKEERKGKGADGCPAENGSAPASAAAAATTTATATAGKASAPAPAAAASTVPATAVKAPAGGEGIVFFATPNSTEANLKCWLVAGAAGIKLINGTAEQG